MASMASTLLHRALMPFTGKASVNKIAGAMPSKCYCTCAVKPLRWNKLYSRKQRKLGTVRRAVDDEESTSSTETNSSPVDTKLEDATSSRTEQSKPVQDRKAAVKAEVQRGKNTALITGAISVLLGVGYLVLIQLLDTRGIELIPPPPEAFDP